MDELYTLLLHPNSTASLTMRSAGAGRRSVLFSRRTKADECPCFDPAVASLNVHMSRPEHYEAANVEGGRQH